MSSIEYGNVVNRRLATLDAAISAPSYISSEGKRMICSCIRYCVVSIRLIFEPCRLSSRSKSVVSRPGDLDELDLPEVSFVLEEADLIVGGSCR